jgi:hypothetical protein
MAALMGLQSLHWTTLVIRVGVSKFHEALQAAVLLAGQVTVMQLANNGDGTSATANTKAK